MVNLPQATGKRTSARDKQTRSSVSSARKKVKKAPTLEDVVSIDPSRPTSGVERNPRPRLRKKRVSSSPQRSTAPVDAIDKPQRTLTPPQRSQRATAHSGESIAERLKLASLSTAELHEIVAFSLDEIQNRRVMDQDLDAILEQGFRECFTNNGIATMPRCINGVVVVPGSVLVKNARGDHECNLYTVRIGDEDRWSWDFDERILLSKTFTDGQLRKTITLYPAYDGMLLFGHDRKKGSKAGSAFPVHTYKSGGQKALQLAMDDDELNGRFVMAPAVESRNLPVPTGIEDDD